jgi:RNA-directed DNA polymerase
VLGLRLATELVAQACAGVGGARSTSEADESRSREGALVLGASEGAEGWEIGVSLITPEKVRKLQMALYVKAKQEPQFRFYQLYDKIYRIDILEHAWAVCRSKRGSPGVDGITFDEIERMGVGPWIVALQEDLRTEQYKPAPVRRVLIPKPGGGERPLGIPTIRDRVAQTAAKLVIEPIFESAFDDAAHAYRPGRSAVDAVEAVQQALREGQTEVVDADLSKYFDTIPHDALMQCVARRISDRRVLHLIKMWLKTPIEETDDQGRKYLSGGKSSTHGTPQGGVISPLLANIYIHRFIKAFRKYGLAEEYGAFLANYADDFVIVCRRGAELILRRVDQWMSQIGLKLNREKTVVKDAWESSFDFLGYTFGPQYTGRTGRQHLGVMPSKKACRQFRERVRLRLRSGDMRPLPQVVATLNRTIRGWANYFNYGRIARTRKAMDSYVVERVRGFLRRRHHRAGRGTEQFSADYIWDVLGVLKLEAMPRRQFA